MNYLLDRAGEIVAREELVKRLWPGGVFVDYEQGLARIINRLREALGDTHENPRFIETIPRRGYRFIAPVQQFLQKGPGVVADDQFRIAVLPFRSEGKAETQEYVADGLTEEVIAHLNHVNPAKLAVVARASVMKYRRKNVSLEEVGRELRVSHAVTGTLRAWDDRLRLSVELVCCADSTSLWASSYEESTADAFSIPAKISRRIAHELAIELLHEDSTAPAPSRNRRAQEAYLRARHLCTRKSVETFRRSIAYLEEAVQLDPEFALAYATHAECLVKGANWAIFPPREVMPRAKQLAATAIALTHKMVEARVVLAYASFAFDWDWPRAEREFIALLSENPNAVIANHWYAFALAAHARTEEALLRLRDCLDLDPLSLGSRGVLAWTLYCARQYDEAYEHCRSAIELDSEYAPMHAYCGLALAAKEIFGEALIEFHRARVISGDLPVMVALEGYGFAVAGQHQRAEDTLAHLANMAHREYVPDYFVAAIHAALGQTDVAVDKLDASYENRGSWLIFANVDPRFSALVPEPRFLALMERLGLREANAGSKSAA